MFQRSFKLSPSSRSHFMWNTVKSRKKLASSIAETWNTYLCKYTHLSIYLKKVDAKDRGMFHDVIVLFALRCSKNCITCKVLCCIAVLFRLPVWFSVKCFAVYWILVLLMIWLKISNVKVAFYLCMQLMLRFDKDGNWVGFLELLGKFSGCVFCWCFWMQFAVLLNK